jgi:hypothetical protein
MDPVGVRRRQVTSLLRCARDGESSQTFVFALSYEKLSTPETFAL